MKKIYGTCEKNFTLWDLISEQLNQSPCLRLINSYFSSPLCDSETYWGLITFVFEKTHILPLKLYSDSITYMFEFWIIVLINVTNKVLNTDEYHKRELSCWLSFMCGNVNSSTLSGSWVLNNIYFRHWHSYFDFWLCYFKEWETENHQNAASAY